MERFFGGERAAEQREAHVPELHFAAERGGSFFFDGGTELVNGNQDGTMRTRTIKTPTTMRIDAELALITTSKTTGTGDPRTENGIPRHYMHRGGGTGLYDLRQGLGDVTRDW